MGICGRPHVLSGTSVIRFCRMLLHGILRDSGRLRCGKLLRSEGSLLVTFRNRSGVTSPAIRAFMRTLLLRDRY